MLFSLPHTLNLSDEMHSCVRSWNPQQFYTHSLATLWKSRPVDYLPNHTRDKAKTAVVFST